ncbi:hypothetical protein ACN6MY_22820 [Peribacillus sp. B-H-3]|uniref:hypothetical protein n=1 Tax=Peribacillus sp. B-H-3 TaxID=3400420 RepID=UPI003B019B2A
MKQYMSLFALLTPILLFYMMFETPLFSFASNDLYYPMIGLGYVIAILIAWFSPRGVWRVVSLFILAIIPVGFIILAIGIGMSGL